MLGFQCDGITEVAFEKINSSKKIQDSAKYDELVYMSMFRFYSPRKRHETRFL